MTDTPARTGYLQATGGAAQGAGAFGRLEAVLHPLDPLDFFTFAQLDTFRGWSTGAGARLTFHF